MGNMHHWLIAMDGPAQIKYTRYIR